MNGLTHRSTSVLGWEYGQEPKLPFQLELEDGSNLEYQDLFRVLPGRRITGLSLWQGQLVVAKLFLGPRAEKDAMRDRKGNEYLIKAAIASPALLHQARIKGKAYLVLLYEYLREANTFQQSWLMADGKIRRVLLERLVAMVASQHKAGIYQKDAHLENFMVVNGDIYAIDGGEYRDTGASLSIRDSVQNLGLLFAQLPKSELLENDDLVDVYRVARRWGKGCISRDAIMAEADRCRYYRSRKLVKKAFRNCSEFVVRSNCHLYICQRRDLPCDVLDSWLQEHADGPLDGEKLLKSGNSQTVWESRLNGMNVVVKRYNIKNISHAMRRLMRCSRASRSWANAHRLRAYHISTPKPLAMIEERWGPFRQRAWLITMRARGVSASRYIPDHMGDDALERLASVVRSFGENGLVHGDMKATNFMMTGETIEVIDLDSMFRPLTAPVLRARVAKDRRRFLQNWRDAGLRERFARLLKPGFG